MSGNSEINVVDSNRRRKLSFETVWVIISVIALIMLGIRNFSSLRTDVAFAWITLFVCLVTLIISVIISGTTENKAIKKSADMVIILWFAVMIFNTICLASLTRLAR